jgi:hypothetical protein
MARENAPIWRAAMAIITVHGGDYARGRAWFYPSPRDNSHGFGFVVRHHNRQLRRIPIEDIGGAEPATVEAIRTLGGDEAMVEALAQLSDGERAGAFVALFADGSLLLASADPETCWRICAGRGAHCST